ncbi:MAG: site-specific DNA-methyltransferase [Promethearchaeota archaeon]|nr:MAG: site-specific DNA-methyltransferase [Candidatus Lokiarchaeota archaeon]
MPLSLKSTHRIFYKSSTRMGEIPDDSVHLVVTSPPYPMIEMWDQIFIDQNPKIAKAMEEGDGPQAFSLMHDILHEVWTELYRVVVPGGIVCINIGDATRSLQSQFYLFPSHAEIISRMHQLGFQSLPEIIWRKETNSPTKFMGSGMLPSNAYVTLEHEYILIFRKGAGRNFSKEEEKERRRASAYFWEERNSWFSDIWTFKGEQQSLQSHSSISDSNSFPNRTRSGAFPFELAFRLISMFSIYGDVILDPFMGTGTTSAAAMFMGRSSFGFEMDNSFQQIISQKVEEILCAAPKLLQTRINAHRLFIERRIQQSKVPKYTNDILQVPVITKQERFMSFPQLIKINSTGTGKYEGEYTPFK